MEISVLEVIILREVIGKVFVYSSPLPSAVSNARGTNKAKIAPMAVASSIMEILSVPTLEINKVTIIVSSTGRAKKNAVAGFLEATFRSFKTYPASGLRVLTEKSVVSMRVILVRAPLDMVLTIFRLHLPTKNESSAYPARAAEANSVVRVMLS